MDFDDLSELDERAIDNILHDAVNDDLVGLVDDANWNAMSHAVEQLSATHDYERAPESNFSLPYHTENKISFDRKTTHKRSYNIEKARESREKNRILRQQGIIPPPPYKPKNAKLELVRQEDGTQAWVYTKKRKYMPSGRYVGANIKKGGRTRMFSSQNARLYEKEQSKFFKQNFKENIPPNVDQESVVVEGATVPKTKRAPIRKHRKASVRRGGMTSRKPDGLADVTPS